MTAHERVFPQSFRRHGSAAAIAIAVFILAYADGAYSPETQASAAVVVWWGILLGLLVGVAKVERLGRSGRAIGLLLGGFTVWTLLSTSWASSAEAVVAEYNRVLLYLGVFMLVGLLARSGRSGSWLDGLAVGIAAVALVALASRLFPTLFSERGLSTFLPSAQTRLSFPLGYWNGLGVFCALGVPLLLRTAVVSRSWVVRGLALAPIPVIVANIYLASSRGAVAALVVGVLVLVVASSRRAALVAALGAAMLGSAVAVGVLLGRDALVDGPLHSASARSEGRSAAILIVVVCAATAAGYGFACRHWPSAWAPSRRAGRIIGIASVLVGLAVVLAANPIERFEAFKQPPQQFQPSEPGGFVRAHLLSGNGSGRWAFWTSAIDEWRAKPLAGGGAGSYEAWWSQHGSLAYFVKDAHSLYLEVLGELGLVGFVLLVSVLAGGAAIGVSRLARLDDETRLLCATALGVLAAFAVAAGVDWMWELTVVAVVAFVCLALLVGAATLPRPAEPRRLGMSPRARLVAISLVVAVAVVGVVSAGNQLLAGTKLEASRSAAAARDLDRAFDDAVDARDLQPWAASSYLQIALVSERQGQLGTASAAITKATARAPEDWRLWLVRARIETKRGKVAAGVEALRRARSLNPRSPLFASAG